jgi:hypothetical protein
MRDTCASRHHSRPHIFNIDNSLVRLFFMDIFDARVDGGLCTLAKSQHSCSAHAHYEALLPVWNILVHIISGNRNNIVLVNQ